MVAKIVEELWCEEEGFTVGKRIRRFGVLETIRFGGHVRKRPGEPRGLDDFRIEIFFGNFQISRYRAKPSEAPRSKERDTLMAFKRSYTVPAGTFGVGHVRSVDDQLPVFMCVGLAGLTAKVLNLH